MSSDCEITPGDILAAKAEEDALSRIAAVLEPLGAAGRRSVLLRALVRADLLAAEERAKPPKDRVPPWKNEAVALKIARRQCPSCPNGAPPVEDGHIYCAAHIMLANQRQKIKRKLSRAAGVCTQCHKNQPEAGRRWCTSCADAHAAYVARRRADPKASAQRPRMVLPDRTKVEAKILTALADGSLSAEEIALKTLGSTTPRLMQRVKSVLWAMEHDGLVLAAQDGKYTLPIDRAQHEG